jgi:hypothetical protein
MLYINTIQHIFSKLNLIKIGLMCKKITMQKGGIDNVSDGGASHLTLEAKY